MALIKVFDACGDTTTTTGTGTLTLLGTPPAGYRSITGALSNSDNVIIRIESADRSEWEVCESVYTTSGTTASRGTVLASSNAGAAVNFSAGTKNVYIVTAKELSWVGTLTTAGDTAMHDGTKPARVAGVGYATGVGGTVTQSTNKTTGVTLNKLSGAITMNNASLAAAAEAKFTVTNSTVAATDTVVVCIKSGGTSGSYLIAVCAVGSGSFDIVISNVSSGSLSEAVVINFAVIKAVTS